jgi:UDP-glucose 4-epimerase
MNSKHTYLTTHSGTGYIGSFTVLALIQAGYKVVIIDNLYNSSSEVINRIELLTGVRPKLYDADITNETKLDDILAENPDIDNVIHFAALKVSNSFQISMVTS